MFQTWGKKILKSQEGNIPIEIAFPKNCNETTRQYFKVEVYGNINCDASINGDVICHGKIECNQINGDVKECGGYISCQVDINGDVNCGYNVTCGNYISGDVNCGGDVECRKIEGNVECQGNIIYK